MKRLTKSILLLPLLGLAVSTMGFSLIGPFKNGAAPNDWQAAGFGGQPAGLGYSLGGGVGGLMFPLEGYRGNVPVLPYAFDESFLRYFGNDGVTAVSNAFKILNDLPPFTTMSHDLSEFPWDSKQAVRFNQQFQTLGLEDVKSLTLAAIIEHMGLAKPERFVWSLRSRITFPTITNYATIMMNYDPVATFQPSRYVNGILYSFLIEDAIGPMGGEWASAVEFYRSDPYYLPYSAVAGGLGSSDDEFGSQPGVFTVSGLGPGEYYTGLSRDDIGGLKFLYGTNNMVTELLLADVTGGQPTGNAGSPWAPFFGSTNVFLNATNAIFSTNVLGTNLIRQGLRPGANKIVFKQVQFDSLLGQIFNPVTNKYTDTVISNSTPIIQPVQRASVQPDILFLVQDLGLVRGVPVSFRRTDTTGWQNNDPINGFSNLGGPGVITPQVQMLYSDLLPYFLNFQPFSLDEISAASSFIWGSFYGTTNAPII